MVAPIYIKLDEDDYVLDLVHYQPGSYTLFEGELPQEEGVPAFYCGCYQLIDGEFVLDQEKYDLLYPEEEDPGIPPIF